MRTKRRNDEVKFTFRCNQGNTEIAGVPLGAIGEWVGRMGGDDLAVEELIYTGKATCNSLEFTITLEKKGGKNEPA
jgi:hypothetical protein